MSITTEQRSAVVEILDPQAFVNSMRSFTLAKLIDTDDNTDYFSASVDGIADSKCYVGSIFLSHGGMNDLVIAVHSPDPIAGTEQYIVVELEPGWRQEGINTPILRPRQIAYANVINWQTTLNL